MSRENKFDSLEEGIHGFFPSSKIRHRTDVGLVPKCGACGLYKGCQSPKMEPYGKGRRHVLIVGEAPGETEDNQGRPFVGKAGQYLRKVLGGLGIDLDKDALITNALICRPPKNRTPDAKQISYCQPNLFATIRRFEPHVVLTLGRSALASVITERWKSTVGPLERWVGWKIPAAGCWICPTYHPSYLLRVKSDVLDRMFLSHLEQAFAIEDPPPGLENYLRQIDVLYDGDEIYQSLRWMDEQGGWIAFDYETNCLKPDYSEARIVSCAVSNGKRTIAYPWIVGKEWTGHLLKSKQTRKIASNLKFEERWTLKEFGFKVARWGWDTMLAAHCLDNRPGICSLKFQAFVQLGVETYNAHIEPYLREAKGPYNRVHEIAVEDLLYYNGLDALLEHRLAQVQRKALGYEG